jgi:hypothetical protein
MAPAASFLCADLFDLNLYLIESPRLVRCATVHLYRGNIDGRLPGGASLLYAV